ncbi:unnamed protein product [Larinioides sclopetarius]|uniref:Uncharacterized protein n=1 Tax=Larinioides sclopetarius TaxID=280406 RepID=A0AAV2B624_9ARAC
MARFVSLETIILTSTFFICVFSIWTNYCAAFSVSDLKRFHCDDFCKIVACESIADCSKGRIIRNASYCGCCDACIKFLEINEPCEKPVEGSLKDIKAPRCKDGLKCINGKCSQACSRHLDYLNQSMGISFNIHPQEHCTKTGDFERLQCIKDLCYCANPITGEVESRIVKTAYISKLPCYAGALTKQELVSEAIILEEKIMIF